EELDAGHHRREGLLHPGLPGQCERAHRAPVERLAQREDAGPRGASVQPGELERGLVRLGAGVAEEHAAALPRAGQTLQPRGEGQLRRRREVVRHVGELRGLPGHGVDEHGVCVPERVHGDAAEEVEVTSTRGVPQVAALAALEQRHPRPEAAYEVALRLDPPGRRIRHPETTSVPIPFSVNISTSTECGTRPSMIAAVSTPPSTASRHACILGIIPDSSRGIIARGSVEVRCDTSESRFGQSAYRPGTSVSTTSLTAPRATARAAAAASALTLSECPGWSRSGAMLETTGMRPARTWSSTVCGSTCTTSPTRPRSCGTPSRTTPRRLPPNRPASSPLSPVARGPWAVVLAPICGFDRQSVVWRRGAYSG